MMSVDLAWLSGPEIEAFWRFVYSRRCAPGEGERPKRESKGKALLFAPYDWFMFRKPGTRFVVHHNPSDMSIRRAALLRMLDVGERIDFVEDEDVAAQTLCVEHDGATLRGSQAAAALTRVLPIFLWLRPIRRVPGVGSLVLRLMSQRR